MPNRLPARRRWTWLVLASLAALLLHQASMTLGGHDVAAAATLNPPVADAPAHRHSHEEPAAPTDVAGSLDCAPGGGDALLPLPASVIEAVGDVRLRPPVAAAQHRPTPSLDRIDDRARDPAWHQVFLI